MAGNTTNRKPHANEPGYKCELRNRVSGVGHVVIYDGNLIGYKGLEMGRWMTVCTAHHSTIFHSALPLARAHMKNPTFCKECVQMANYQPPAYVPV